MSSKTYRMFYRIRLESFLALIKTRTYFASGDDEADEVIIAGTKTGHGIV